MTDRTFPDGYIETVGEAVFRELRHEVDIDEEDLLGHIINLEASRIADGWHDDRLPAVSAPFTEADVQRGIALLTLLVKISPVLADPGSGEIKLRNLQELEETT